jgi:hypothetical protein
VREVHHRWLERRRGKRSGGWQRGRLQLSRVDGFALVYLPAQAAQLGSLPKSAVTRGGLGKIREKGRRRGGDEGEGRKAGLRRRALLVLSSAGLDIWTFGNGGARSREGL